MIEVLAKHDRVIMKEIDRAEKTVGQIVLSDNGRERANTYQVVSVGPGTNNPFSGQFIPTQYKVGDEVFVHKVHVHEIQYDGETYYITKDNEILCHIVDTDDLHQLNIL